VVPPELAALFPRTAAEAGAVRSTQYWTSPRIFLWVLSAATGGLAGRTWEAENLTKKYSGTSFPEFCSLSV
jgi:hypothetical protein